VEGAGAGGPKARPGPACCRGAPAGPCKTGGGAGGGGGGCVPEFAEGERGEAGGFSGDLIDFGAEPGGEGGEFAVSAGVAEAHAGAESHAVGDESLHGGLGEEEESGVGEEAGFSEEAGVVLEGHGAGDDAEGSAGGCVGFEERKEAAVAADFLGDASEESVSLGAARAAGELGGGGEGGGDGSGGGAADAGEPELFGDLVDGGGIDDAAGDAPLHNEVANPGGGCSFRHDEWTPRQTPRSPADAEPASGWAGLAVEYTDEREIRPAKNGAGRRFCAAGPLSDR